MDKELAFLGGIATLFLVVIIVFVMWAFSLPSPTVCDRSKPTAGDIVSCIATRTAEARKK